MERNLCQVDQLSFEGDVATDRHTGMQRFPQCHPIVPRSQGPSRKQITMLPSADNPHCTFLLSCRFSPTEALSRWAHETWTHFPWVR